MPCSSKSQTALLIKTDFQDHDVIFVFTLFYLKIAIFLKYMFNEIYLKKISLPLTSAFFYVKNIQGFTRQDMKDDKDVASGDTAFRYKYDNILFISGWEMT